MADEQIEGLPQGATVRPLGGEQHEEIEGLPAGATTRPLTGAATVKEPPKESWLHRTFAPRSVSSGPMTSEMPGSFEGHPENVGEYAPATIGEMAGGMKDIAVSMGQNKDIDQMAHGAHRMIGGAMSAAAPALPFAAAAAPVGTALTLAGGYVGQKALSAGAEYAGAEPGSGRGELAGDFGALIGGGIGAKVAGRYSPAAIEARRLAAGPANVEKSLATPPGKAGARAAAMKEDLSIATKDLAAIEKETPAKVSTFLKRGKGAENFHELAEKIDARQDKLWDEGHQPGIDRHAEAMIDHEKVRTAGQGAMTPEAREAAPAEAQAADIWLQGIAKERNLKSTDALIREINADLKGKDVGTRYGPLGIRVRQAVVQALRDEVENVLTASGEKGVKAVNRRWGALENIKGRLAERAVQEANAEAKGGVLPDWAHLYSFLHPDAGLSVGAGVAVGKMLRPSASSRLTKGMRQLGRTNLEAPFEAMPPSDWREGVETNPARLLPAPAHQIPIPEEPAIPARGGVEAKRMVFRDPVSGKMQRGYTGEPATEPMQGRVADYWSGDQGPIKGEYVPPEKAAQAISHEPIGKVKAKRGAKDKGLAGGSVEEQAAEISRKAPTREERRAAPRNTVGPDFMRTTLLNTLRKQLETLPEGRDRDIIQSQYDDALAHPFERHEGEADINRIKEKGKPTKTRAEAEKNVEARKAGGATKFKKGTITEDDVKTLHAQLDKTKSIKKTRELIKEFFKAKKGDTIQ